MADRDPEGPPPPPPRSSRRDDDDRRHRSRSPDRRRSRRSPSPRRRRSRSPRRDRRRSRSPPRSSGRSGGRWDRGTSSAPKADPMAAQRVLLQQQALMAHAGLMGDKKQREVYVGNLAIGVVTEPVIRELFNAALEAFVPNPSNMPPVVSAHMSGEGRFAFVELRNPELANAAMALDKLSRSMSERWKDIQCRPLVRRARTGKMSRISCHIDSRFCWRIIRITVPRCFNGHVCYCAIKLQRV
eukprot:TRINITY_DN12142_c0_g2_i13.p2 TRINITY_DN12142_c0_g2~~TRINITY_DN12142_c0_g2_i13.p2  ORF type:complete len:242 (+),score=16.12 TRINITY_DN12142_c0_g2_i13:2510-3235(+)